MPILQADSRTVKVTMAAIPISFLSDIIGTSIKLSSVLIITHLAFLEGNMISRPLGTTVIKSFWYTDFADNTGKSGFIPFRVQYPAACGGRKGSGLAPRLIPFIRAERSVEQRQGT